MAPSSNRYWKSSDAPTNANLQYLESLARYWEGMTTDHFMDKVRGVIGVKRMLPEAVARHFAWPPLFIGAAADDWSGERLQEEARAFCTALEEGLTKAFADPALAKDGTADLSDRPPTRGEEVREALDAYREDRGQATHSRLRDAVSGTHIQRYFDQLEKWLGRKRQSSAGRSIDYEIACVLGEISGRINELHAQAATYDFTARGR